MQFTPLHKPRRHRFTKPPAGARLRLDHPWAQNLVLALIFNENGGCQVNDLVGQKRILHLIGNPQPWENTPYGSGLHLRANTGEILQSEIDAGDFSYRFLKGFTIITRCRLGTSGWNFPFQLADNSSFGPEIIYQVNTDNRIQLFANSGWFEATDGRITQNAWHELAAASDYTVAGTGTWTNRIKQAVISQNDPPNSPATLGELTLGTLYWNGAKSYSDILYDYFYLFDRRLPDNIILSITNEPYAFLR